MIPCFPQVYASGNGILEFYQDGYEDVTVESMTEDMLDPSTYTKQSLKKRNGTGRGAGLQAVHI